jgi:phosphoenolpyruvate carboxykinase (GTP)
VTIETTTALTTNKKLIEWVEEVASLAQPESVHWCDGSAEEYDEMAQALVDAGTFERLSDAKRPNSYLALSDPGDVARVEDRTSSARSASGTRVPTNQLQDPGEMRRDAGAGFSRVMSQVARCTTCRPRGAGSARGSPRWRPATYSAYCVAAPCGS